MKQLPFLHIATIVFFLSACQPLPTNDADTKLSMPASTPPNIQPTPMETPLYFAKAYKASRNFYDGKFTLNIDAEVTYDAEAPYAIFTVEDTDFDPTIVDKVLAYFCEDKPIHDKDGKVITDLSAPLTHGYVDLGGACRGTLDLEQLGKRFAFYSSRQNHNQMMLDTSHWYVEEAENNYRNADLKPPFTKESINHIVHKAEEFLGAMGIQRFTCRQVSVSQQLCLNLSDGYYMLSFTPDINGVPIACGRGYRHCIDELNECIRVYIDDKGISAFEWINHVKITKSTLDMPLIDLDTAKDGVFTQIQQWCNDIDKACTIVDHVITVTDIRLEYNRVDEGTSELIPTWIFYGYHTCHGELDFISKEQQIQMKIERYPFYAVNAVDHEASQ